LSLRFANFFGLYKFAQVCTSSDKKVVVLLMDTVGRTLTADAKVVTIFIVFFFQILLLFLDSLNFYFCARSLLAAQYSSQYNNLSNDGESCTATCAIKLNRFRFLIGKSKSLSAPQKPLLF